RAWLAGEADKMKYEARAAVDTLYQRHAEEVENLFQSELRQGRTWPREMILDFVLGRKMRTSAGRDTKRARAQGQKRIEAQQTRPTSAKGDAASGRSKTGNTPEDRLKGMDI